MPDIYLCGHGGWGIIGYSSIFADVPAGTEIVLYREIGQVLYVDEATAILSQSAGALEPARVIGAYEHSPDLTLYPAPEFWGDFGAAATAGATNWHAVASETRLSSLLQRYAGSRMHWIACEVRQLRRV